MDTVRRIDCYVGARLRERRATMGMTQKDFAEVLGLSYQQIQKYETGHSRLSAGKLFVLSGKLGVDVAWFFAGCDPKSAIRPLHHGGAQRSLITISRCEQQMTPERRNIFRELAKDMAAKSAAA